MKDLEVHDLMRIAETIKAVHGYDFRNYALSSFKRRMMRMVEARKLTVEDLITKVKTQPAFIEDFIDHLTVNVTEMFRDPKFWLVMRNKVIPSLMQDRKQIRIWHAGCSSGEEVLSMSIVCSELGILQDVTILATDIDAGTLDKARQQSCLSHSLDAYEQNYLLAAGGRKSLKDYYAVENGRAIFDKDLARNTTFQRHDLVTGTLTQQFDIILCRNVMIYFNQALQNDVLTRLHRRLPRKGYLAVGAKESMLWCDMASKFEVVTHEEKIYRKAFD